jgi:hypothetical protein
MAFNNVVTHAVRPTSYTTRGDVTRSIDTVTSTR